MTGPFFPSVDPTTLRLRDQHLPQRLQPTDLRETIEDTAGGMVVAAAPLTGAYNDTLGQYLLGVDPTGLAAVTPAAVTLTDAATVAINSAAGRIFKLSAAGNRTLGIPANPVDGRSIVIAHTASGGARTLSLTTGSSGAFAFGTDITALTATTSGLTDYIGCLYDGGAARWRVLAYIKGF